MSTRIKKICGAFFLFGILVIGSLGVLEYQTRPMDGNGDLVVFEVKEGESSHDIIVNLRSKGLIRSQFFTKVKMKTMRNSKFYVGTYNLKNNWSTQDLLRHMTQINNVNGSKETRVLIKEGSWAKDIAKSIAANTNVTEDELLNLWNDKSYIESIMSTYPQLPNEILDNKDARVLMEGFLYPDTYNFYRETTAQDVTKKILDNGANRYKELESQIDTSEYSYYELVTLASIVEYEAHKVEDMKLIAGVFFNRLDIGMKLQSSVTVCYSLYEFNDWKDCESAENNQFDSPYNTYRYEGLPPGPILNPSNKAMSAVLNYTDSDYLFFLADVYGDGKVYYSETFEQHNIYKKQYLGG